MMNGRRINRDLLDNIFEFVRVNHNLRLRFINQLLKLTPVQSPIERYQDCSQFPASEERVQIFDTVVGQYCYTITLLNASAITQPIRQPIGTVVQFTIGK